MHPEDTITCFRSHMGLWAIEPHWLHHAVQAVQGNLWPLRSEAMLAAEVRRDAGKLYAQRDTVAIIRVQDQLTKGVSKFGGTSTILTKRALQQAVRAEDVTSILLAIDSPGGQVDGVQDLADAIQQARQSKAVHAYIEDLGASAAYWIASQAQKITANATAFIGSIGVFAILQDLSGAAEREGVKVRVVSTGPYKGLGVPGTPLVQETIDEVQKHVDQIAEFFFAAVRKGRGMGAQALASATDGRIWIAAEAHQMRLIDGIQSFDEAFAEAATARPRRRYAASDSPHRQLQAAWGNL